MSGTSLDGLDIVHAHFEKNDKWNFTILNRKTYSYPNGWVEKLKFNINLSALNLLELNHQYGLYLAQKIKQFLQEFNIPEKTIDLISSHGHTLFHQPELGYTLQIGNGPEIFAHTNITTVCDFRTQDVALKGQGAPLVPIGDLMLFSQYDACINLGGFANISFEKHNQRIAFDICPVNFVLNTLSQRLGLTYDDKGTIARSGSINHKLLLKLNQLEYYTKALPKSLGAEWVNNYIFPLIKDSPIQTEDIMATFTQHCADQIRAVLKKYDLQNILCTGGGTYNDFLLEQIQKNHNANIHIPHTSIIDFKEALVFGFLGILKLRGENNCLSSVTGALRDHSSGLIYC